MYYCTTYRDSMFAYLAINFSINKLFSAIVLPALCRWPVEYERHFNFEYIQRDSQHFFDANAIAIKWKNQMWNFELWPHFFGAQKGEERQQAQ